MAFKDMLKYLRNREGLSQRALAERVGLSASTISMYEVGAREPDFETEETLADFFNVDLNTLRGIDAEQFTLSEEEISLIKKYRNADSTTKEMINRMLLFTYIQEKEGDQNANSKKD